MILNTTQLCTVDMEIRELERLSINLVPELVFMESDTMLVQYIISRWSLQYRQAMNKNKILYVFNQYYVSLLKFYLPGIQVSMQAQEIEDMFLLFR